MVVGLKTGVGTTEGKIGAFTHWPVWALSARNRDVGRVVKMNTKKGRSHGILILTTEELLSAQLNLPWLLPERLLAEAPASSEYTPNLHFRETLEGWMLAAY